MVYMIKTQRKTAVAQKKKRNIEQDVEQTEGDPIPGETNDQQADPHQSSGKKILWNEDPTDHPAKKETAQLDHQKCSPENPASDKLGEIF